MRRVHLQPLAHYQYVATTTNKQTTTLHITGRGEAGGEEGRRAAEHQGRAAGVGGVLCVQRGKGEERERVVGLCARAAA